MSNIKITAAARFLVSNIVSGNITYLEAAKNRPDLKDQMDAYIELKKLNINKLSK